MLLNQSLRFLTVAYEAPHLSAIDVQYHARLAIKSVVTHVRRSPDGFSFQLVQNLHPIKVVSTPANDFSYAAGWQERGTSR